MSTFNIKGKLTENPNYFEFGNDAKGMKLLVTTENAYSDPVELVCFNEELIDKFKTKLKEDVSISAKGNIKSKKWTKNDRTSYFTSLIINSINISKD